MAAFTMHLTRLNSEITAIVIEAECLADALEKFNYREDYDLDDLDWTHADTEAVAVIKVDKGSMCMGSYPLAMEDARFMTSVSLPDIAADPQAAQAAWENLSMDRETPVARGKRTMGRL